MKKIDGDAHWRSPIQIQMNGSIYIHVPFCKQKCHYCSFYVIKSRQEGFELYTKALIEEIRQTKGIFKKVESIYFGGGTPTQLPMPYFRQIIEKLEHSQEVTLEANPEDLDYEKLCEYKSLGVNRLSLGAQSFCDSDLVMLGRNHNSSKTLQAIGDAKRAGIDNVSIDLMIDLPNQSKSSIEKSLKTIESLDIEHVSLYNLQIEKNSLFYAKRDELSLPDEAQSLELYNKAIDSLISYGFERYEISAFCKNKKRSRHNTGYWLGREFIGLGPAAFSFRQNRRYQNAKSLHRWARAVQNSESAVEFSEQLEANKQIKERLAIALRLTDGIELNEWELEDQTLKEIELLLEKRWLIKNKNNLKLSNSGLLFYDSVASALI